VSGLQEENIMKILMFTLTMVFRRKKLWYLSIDEGPRSRRYGRTAALRLLVQPCDEDDDDDCYYLFFFQ
jgi:hypothetical protein